ncbi:MAG: HlyD family type I secretion periplasmic adaptor subunit [Rickettsiaceae bacterium]|nr:HlyD family type I secretion periplasmic adaptor subunit [Rickettsiaceae bacterium]
MPGMGMPQKQQKKPFNLQESIRNFSFKALLTKTLMGMQNSVKFIDQFINFVIKKDNPTTNDVIEKARSPILFGVYIIVFFVLIGGLWAATAPLDSATVAIGKVISDTNKKILNHPEGGIIKAIHVKIGQSVKEGDVLVELDDTKYRAQYEIYLNQYRISLASQSRLQAELNDKDIIEYPEFLTNDKSVDEVAKIIQTQNNLFESRKELERSQIESTQKKIEQFYKKIEGLKARKLSFQKSLEGFQDRLQATKKLKKQGFANQATVIELESKEAEAQSQIAFSDTEIAQTEQEITKSQIELLGFDSKNINDKLKELKETQAQLSQSREQFFQTADYLKRAKITSPVDGIVNQIYYHTIDSSVPPSQPIVEVSPTSDSLIIEAKIMPKNISSIAAGLESKIRFSAFKSRTTPLFMGTVISVSPDIIIPDQRTPLADPKLAGGYYLALIELDMDVFNEVAKPRNLTLQPGMQAEVQIITGTRTLLRYLLDPALDAMFKGFKEK